jgi:branched-chain amino acid transport system ATP-binding protein
MLQVEAIDTFYGRSQVLFGMNLEVSAGEMVALMGRNGMGKTTTVRSIMGLTRPARGSVRFRGSEIAGLPAYRIAKLGLGLVPEGRQIFPNLTVRENLVATAANRAGAASPWTLARVFGLFPRLDERRDSMGNQLSGGEQQMLAIGRALMTNPGLLILDEATEGLAPLIRAEIWSCLENLKREGQAILVTATSLWKKAGWSGPDARPTCAPTRRSSTAISASEPGRLNFFKGSGAIIGLTG